MLETSRRKDGNGNVSKGKNGKEKELIDWNRVLAGNVEGLYGGKELEMIKKEETQTVKKNWLSKAVRMVVRRGVHWEDEWGVEERLVLSELGRKIVAEEWSVGKEAPLKDRRVTRRESTAFGWVSKNSIALQLCQRHPVSSYRGLANCNLHEHTKAAWVGAHYKCVDPKVKAGPLGYGSIPDDGLDCRVRAISQVVPIPGP
jgi:hypothetical protein